MVNPQRLVFVDMTRRDCHDHLAAVERECCRFDGIESGTNRMDHVCECAAALHEVGYVMMCPNVSARLVNPGR